MVVYVNGDSHAAAAEAAVPCGWAEDDPFYYGMGKRPHPENERVSFGCEIANRLHAILDIDAQSGASNARIMRTTRQWLDHAQPSAKDLVIIQWSTWEREEWLIDGEYYQVGASGTDSVPESHQDQYKEFVQKVDWVACRNHWHRAIWNLHCELAEQKVPHLFFNGNNHFLGETELLDWQHSFIGPYDPNSTYDALLRLNGYKPVNSHSWHFGADAHCFWADYVLQYVHDHIL
jgi:hypothetical protein